MRVIYSALIILLSAIDRLTHKLTELAPLYILPTKLSPTGRRNYAGGTLLPAVICDVI